MRRSQWCLIAALAFAAGCAETADQTKDTSPNGPGPQFGPPAVANPYCSPITSGAIDTELHNLFIKNAWPDESSTKGKFLTVQSLLSGGDVSGAQTSTRSLVGFITNKFQHLTPAEQAASQTLYDQLVKDLYCYVGISGTVFDLNPGDPKKAFSITGVGGVLFQANIVPIGTMVSLTDISGLPCPLNTTLDCFPGFLAISLYPNAVLPQPATVVLCTSPSIPSTVLVGHEDPTVGFEILTPSPVPPELSSTCTSSSFQPPAKTDWLASVLGTAADFFLPKPAQASPMMFLGGVGGLTSKFSPFGLVNGTITGTGGLGGKTTSFVPPASASASTTAAAAPPNNPPLPATYVQGGVGTNTTTGLPFVTIVTQGGDAGPNNGVNPVPGVTVTFTTANSQLYDPDSNAKVCDATGTIPASGQIQVVTDVNGVATLPCLNFGNTAGFANLSASFDPTSLNFPNSNLVTILASDGTTTGSTLNWLVKSNAGQPAALGFTTAPSNAAQAGVQLTQQPVLQLFDGLGNEVYLAGVTVTASITTGGGVVTYTSPVTTDANGVATFTDLTIGGKVAGVAQTLSFSFTGISQAMTAQVQLSAGPASQLAITTQASASVQAGVQFGTQPVVAIQDQFGNATTSTAAVAATIATGLGTLAGTTSVNAIAGVATFTNLRIDGLAGDRTIGFSSGALISATSNTVSVGAGPAASIAIVTQPSSAAQAGVALTTQPVVAIRDQFGNTVNSGAAVTAAIASGAGTLAGTTVINAVGGTATFLDLRIDGATGNRTLSFSSGALTSPASNAIAVGAGSAAKIQTYIAGVAAQSYSYGNNLTPFTNASPAPQVIVTDAFSNPVVNQTIYWSASTSNGGVLTVGATGTPTNASGTAQVTSWLLGDGLNQATASLFATGGTLAIPDAQFSASTPTGVSVFACAAGTGNAKTDLGALSVKAPNGTIKRVTLWMSITGTSSSLSNYDATLEARLNSLTGTLLQSTAGKVQLPGDNGNAVPVTFDFATSIAKQTGSATIWFKLTIAAPANRKPQVWYSSATFKSTDPCYNSLAYAPDSTTVFKRGLSINLTN